MDLAIDWMDRRVWGGLSDEDFAASERARAHLATVLTPDELREFELSHPIWAVVSIIGTQAGFTRMGEGMRLFVPRRTRFERSIVKQLRKRGDFFSIWAELEVALWFDRQEFTVSYQPSRSGPDLAVTDPSGIVTPVEVKAPRPSDDIREHERYVFACITQYAAELDERGLQSLHLEFVNDPHAERWSAANHREVLTFVRSVPVADADGAAIALSGGWEAKLTFVPGPRASATTWGPSWGFDPGTDAKRLRRNLVTANRQLGPKGGGLAVLHTIVGDRPSIGLDLARCALGTLSDCAIEDVYVCSSGRRWSDLQMDGPREVCS